MIDYDKNKKFSYLNYWDVNIYIDGQYPKISL